MCSNVYNYREIYEPLRLSKKKKKKKQLFKYVTSTKTKKF